MGGLVEFLRARLDEDEKVARAASGAPWEASVPNMVHVNAAAQRENRAFRTLGHVANTECAEYQLHIARHDPARVLAEVKAKRQIVDLHGIVHREIGWLADGEEEHGEIPVCGLCVPKHSHYQRREDVPEGACLTVRHLALPYADHPDYRDEWRQAS